MMAFIKFYLINNVALIVAYGLTRLIAELPIFAALTALQKLRLARFCLSMACTIFFILPCYHFLLKLAPQTVDIAAFNAPPELISYMIPSLPIFPGVFFILMGLIIGWLIKLTLHLMSLRPLIKLIKEAYCIRAIKRIQILCADQSFTPFCWSLFFKHYILIPNHCLQHNQHLSLIIAHELQHIRQHDTYWLKFLSILQIIHFWNPIIRAWSKLLSEWQEFACDEALILKNKTTPYAYAKCLLTHNKQLPLKDDACAVAYLHTQSKLLIYRRIAMLFQYKSNKFRISLWLPYLIASLVITSSAFAVNDLTPLPPLEKQKVIQLIQKNHLETLQIEATPEVLDELNTLRSDVHARLAMRQALQRLSQYRPVIHQELEQNHMPTELLAIPLVESGYRMLPASQNRLSAAGIWQIIPNTAKNLGLTVNDEKDERLDLEPSTSAAINYLSALHHQFGDWKLAVIAYAFGEKLTEKLIRETGSKNAWEMAKAKSAPSGLRKYLGMFDANVIIMHNPELLAHK